MRVRELMHEGILTCDAAASPGEIAALLIEHRVHALLVLEAGQPVGVVSDTDLLSGEWLAIDADSLAVMRGLAARDLMTAPPETVDADAEAAEAAALLRERHLGRLLVLDSATPVGVLAVSDLVHALGRAAERPRTVREAMSRGLVVCRPLGVVTGHDLLALYGDREAATVAELMHPPLTVSAGATLREAVDALLAHEVHRLLVVDTDAPDGLPLGILSTADVVAEIAELGSTWRG